MHPGATRDTIQIRVKVKIECAANGFVEAEGPSGIRGEYRGTRDIGRKNK